MLTPIGDKIIIKPLPYTPTSKAGVIMYENDPQLHLGEIVSVGRGRDTLHGFEPIDDLKPGDVVFYYRGAGTRLKWDGEDYMILVYKEVYAFARKE